MLGLGIGKTLERFLPGSIDLIDNVRRNFLPQAAEIGTPLTVGETVPTPEEYWTDHNVTLHHDFSSAAESLAYFHWRNDQYFGYIDLMPISNASDISVLDFGCGPGHDLVGFGIYSKPVRLIGADLSERSLSEARHRLALHGIDCELIHQGSTEASLPLADRSIDLVHSSGVIHHSPNPAAILREFHRVLKPGGRARIMVYHENSLWMHLYVAYQKMIVENAFPGLDLKEAFQKSTDGESCPISRCYMPDDFLDLAEKAGFTGRFLGAAVSAFEMSLLPKRYDAIQSRRLPSSSRAFLSSLEFTMKGWPTFNGVVAGVDSCFELIRQ